MHLSIEADILPVHIRENAWEELRVVERRVKGLALRLRATPDLNYAQALVPRLNGLLIDRIEVTARVLLIHIGLRVVHADIRESRAHADHVLFACIKGHKDARARPRDSCGIAHDRAILPDAAGGKGLAKLRPEIQAIGIAMSAAKIPAAHPARDRIAADRRLGRGHDAERAGQVDQHARRLPRWIREAGRAAAV